MNSDDDTLHALRGLVRAAELIAYELRTANLIAAQNGKGPLTPDVQPRLVGEDYSTLDGDE